MSLTDTAIKNAKPASKAYKLFDGGGLFLLVTPAGQKYWRLKYRHAGKEKLLALGVYPEISLAAARKSREEAREGLTQGADPNTAKKETKRLAALAAATSFEAVAREWYESQRGDWSTSYAKKVMGRWRETFSRRWAAAPLMKSRRTTLSACCVRWKHAACARRPSASFNAHGQCSSTAS